MQAPAKDSNGNVSYNIFDVLDAVDKNFGHPLFSFVPENINHRNDYCGSYNLECLKFQIQNTPQSPIPFNSEYVFDENGSIFLKKPHPLESVKVISVNRGTGNVLARFWGFIDSKFVIKPSCWADGLNGAYKGLIYLCSLPKGNTEKSDNHTFTTGHP